jgi:hypothetical protein
MVIVDEKDEKKGEEKILLFGQWEKVLSLKF